MLKNPAAKYRPFTPVSLPNRQWPSRTISSAPVWLSTDLRDGNQSLFEPMNGERKLKLFQELVRIGFKEIEIGFPAASQIDFDFTRKLIDEGLIPEDVTLMVMTQAREDLIARTVEALRGARRAIVHLYNATAPAWRRIVFGMSVAEVMALVRHHVACLRRLTDACPQTQWVLQYSPETFNLTELEVSLQACQTAIEAWGVSEDRKIIINLPTTVENATPNVFADQIEWMHRHLAPREHIVLSVHPHNDRGSAVASAELALMAGADRVEGCLFGNGERCGNVDIVTLALNLYTQGIHPGLDFLDINGVVRIAEECTAIPVHPRHPYAGDLVFTAFSGSHQDAIRKGLAAQRPDTHWEVPYLPIDPADLGRTYDGVIRVNSQSGKGGIAFLLERERGIVLPRRMQVEFSGVVQRHADACEKEMSGGELWALFQHTYFQGLGRGDEAIRYLEHRLEDGGRRVELTVLMDGEHRTLSGQGNGPIAATVDALGLPLRIEAYEERATGTGADAQALAIVEASAPGTAGTRFGVGLSDNIVTASVWAVISAANRLAAAMAPQATLAA
ncbi:2-isopropylmalate synthase [Azohydromonas caseinilytica]|uniref:2-isopropylmalate synthase n=1 Tax=Azohydromonas caseinilytica TaxID=2728836 RepID=A0A848F715_9BURK|nr:2-isopropylmalate synthase [Azohydromonas caseinilytica]NML14526.1 2-isopropylmalate synthase [Azohydromonas caseinilytica]